MPRICTHHLAACALAVTFVAGTSTSRADTPASAAETIPRDRYWAHVQGLMLGVTVAHCQQPLAAALEDDIAWRDKHWISLGGCALYGASFGTSLARWRPGLWINVIGPAVGVSSVGVGWILSATDVIDADIRMDTYQIMGGILQVAALIRSVQLLRAGPPPPRADGVAIDVSAAPGGLAIIGTW